MLDSISAISTNSTSIDSTADTQRQAKLTDAAQQFEGIFLQQILKPLQSDKSGWGDDDSSDSANDTFSSMGTEAVAKAISSKGGLGIAKQVIHQIGQERNEISQKSTIGY